MSKADKILLKIIGMIGFIGLLIIDWRIGICVFLMMWGNNELHVTYKEANND